MHVLEKQDVPWIHRSDRFFDPRIECYETGLLGVGGLVERVVACDPGVVFVVLCGCRVASAIGTLRAGALEGERE